jgi:zinc protease
VGANLQISMKTIGIKFMTGFNTVLEKISGTTIKKAPPVLLFLLASLTGFSESPITHQYFQLNNGLKVFIKQKNHPSLVNMVISVNIGSKDESRESSGFVHLLEHLILLSKTKSLLPCYPVMELRKKGCYLNAHTDHDLMTFELSLPSRHTQFGLLFLKEKVFNLNTTEEDLIREKHIIAEEVNQLMDTPQNRGTTLVFRALFPNHPYETPLHGNLETINQATLDQLISFYNRYFLADNSSLSVVGDVSVRHMEASIKEVFGSVKKSVSQFRPISKSEPPDKNNEFTIEMDVKQALLLIGFRAPSFDDKDKFAFHILNHILGKGTNPLLGGAYPSRKRLVAGFSTRYLSLKYGGIFLIYLRTDPKQIHLLKRETLKFLNRTNTFRYSQSDFLKKDQLYVTDYLKSAQNQIKLNSEESKEQGLSSAISFARFMLSNKDTQQYNYQEEIDMVSSANLRQIASKYICGKHHITIYILPKKDET